MKKVLLFAVATLFVASFSFGQSITVIELNYADKDSSWTDTEKNALGDFVRESKYGKIVKLEDVKSEDIMAIYYIKGLVKSDKMITDSTGTRPEKPNQWLIHYKENGGTKSFFTTKDPTVNGSDKASVANLMSSGIVQGDDEDIESDPKVDAKFAAKKECNISLPEDDF